MSALTQELAPLENGAVRETANTSKDETRPPKLTQHEAAFLLDRGPYVARLAAQEKKLAYARSIMTVDGEYGPNLPEYVIEELTASVETARQELEGYDAMNRLAEVVELSGAKSVSMIRRELSAKEPDTTMDFEAPDTIEEIPLEEVSEREIEVLSGTRLDADLVKQYMLEAGKFKVLTAEQEVILAKDIEVGLFAQERLDQHGDELSAVEQEELKYLAQLGAQQKELFINSNLRLVISIAKRYTGGGMSFIDLIQEGNAGLIRAVEKFNYEKGYKFSTYGTWWIRQAVTRALADQGRTIRIPVHAVETLNSIARFERQFLLDTGHEATVSDIASEFEMSEQKVTDLKSISRSPVSLHTPLSADGDAELGDVIEDPDQPDVARSALRSETYDKLNTVLETFTDREALVMRMRFGLLDGECKTLEQVGEVIGLTKERVRQIEAKTLSKLRHPSRSHVLRGLQLSND